MAAGDSAAFEAERHRLRAEEYEHLAAVARDMHARFSAGAHGERRLERTLQVLESRGYTILSDRRWPKSRKAQVDFIVVGPGGVFIVDAKNWREVNVVGDRVYRGDADVTDEFAGTADLVGSTRSNLADTGLVYGEVHGYAVFTSRGGIKSVDFYGMTLLSESEAVTSICRRGSRLTADQVNQLVVELNGMFSKYDLTATELDLSMPEPVLPAEVSAVTLAVEVAEPELTIEEIQSALEAGVMALPIEDWMTFLHPSQAQVVHRSFSGPSRVRGSAGTGKTVVGLHRAAHLARKGEGTVLVTTFVRTLSTVLESLFARLAPDVTDRVEFRGVHSFALDLLKRRGVQINLDAKSADRAFERILAQHPNLLSIDPNRIYWREEIDFVIKGRGLTSFDQYVKLARLGRRRRLTDDQRKLVWDLYVEYSRELSRLQVHDWPDVILKAEASLRSHPLEGYRAVIIDEAQDLTSAMVRMLYLLVGNRPDGLNLIGDGQQSIFPGGFTLSDIGISISGRATVMTTNYRNTAEIVAFADSLVLGDEFIDLEGGTGTPDRAGTIARHGNAPTITRFSNRPAHDRELAAHVHALRAAGVSFGDMAVLAMTNWVVTDAATLLRNAGVPTIELTEYKGRTVDAVKVGTVHRAKGLEFKQVLVARTPRALLDGSNLAADSSGLERRELDRRALYVAMTRARDGLWVGVTN